MRVDPYGSFPGHMPARCQQGGSKVKDFGMICWLAMFTNALNEKICCLKCMILFFWGGGIIIQADLFLVDIDCRNKFGENLLRVDS